jgi:hypothetical protein
VNGPPSFPGKWKLDQVDWWSHRPGAALVKVQLPKGDCLGCRAEGHEHNLAEVCWVCGH